MHHASFFFKNFFYSFALLSSFLCDTLGVSLWVDGIVKWPVCVIIPASMHTVLAHSWRVSVIVDILQVKEFPTIIEDTPFVRLWYKRDDEFLVPKTKMFFEIVRYANIVHYTVLIPVVSVITCSCYGDYIISVA